MGKGRVKCHGSHFELEEASEEGTGAVFVPVCVGHRAMNENAVFCRFGSCDSLERNL